MMEFSSPSHPEKMCHVHLDRAAVQIHSDVVTELEEILS